MLELAIANRMVGNTIAGDQIFPAFLPPGSSYPACALWTLIDQPFSDQNGHVGTSQAIVQLSCWTATSKEGEQFIGEATALWDGFAGLIGLTQRYVSGWYFGLFPPWSTGTGSENSVDVVSSWVESDYLLDEGFGWGSPETVFHAIVEIGILYRLPYIGL